MKTILSVCSLLFPSLFLYAQTDRALAIAHYTFSHVADTMQRDRPVREQMVLYIGKDISRYARTGTVFMLPGQAKGPAGMLPPPPPPPPYPNDDWRLSQSYYKIPAQEKLVYLVMSGGGPSGKLLSVEEKMPAIEWSVLSETKNIMGMVCQKARCSFRGRNYEAWFSSQIPYSNGPWKLGGLPGLIVEARDTKNEVVFELTDFKETRDTVIQIRIPANIIKTTPKEYTTYREALQRQAGGDSTMVSNGQAVRFRENNPLEKNR